MRQETSKTAFEIVLYWPSTSVWAWGLSLRVACIPNETLLEKIKFSFVSGYQLKIASGLRKRFCVHFFSQCWDPIWIWCLACRHSLYKQKPVLFYFFLKFKYKYIISPIFTFLSNSSHFLKFT